MVRSKRILPLVAAAAVFYACAPQLGPEPVPASYGTLTVSLESVLTRSSLQSGPDGKTVVWDMDDTFRIFNVEDASYTDVRPVSLGDGGFTADLPLPYPRGEGISIVVTYVDATYRADRTIAAGSPIEQGLYTDGHNCNVMPMSSRILPLEKDSPASLVLTPLNALAEVGMLNIPCKDTDRIRNIHITTTAVRGTRSNQLTCDSYLFMVDTEGFTNEIEDYLSDKYIFDGEYAPYLELTSDELRPYPEGSITAYFQTPGYIQPQGDPSGTYMQSIRVDITTDNNIISKTFTNVEEAKVKFTCGRITSFSLNMSDATVTERKSFSVEWSPGYLTYDAASKAYAFAEPEERGLFFKIGSLMGFDPFSSIPAEDYFGHSRKLVNYRYYDSDHSILDSDSNLFWSEGAADLKAYRKDEDGNIVPFSPSSYEDIDFIAYDPNASYDRLKHDPCAYVKDGHSDWRMPTPDELQELVDLAQENLGNWRVWSYGSDVLTTTDGKPHMVEIKGRDGNGVTLSTTSYMTHSHALTTSGAYMNTWNYSIEISYSESIYIPSNKITPYLLKEVGYMGTPVFMFTSLTSLRANYECDGAKVSPSGNSTTFSYNNATALKQGATMVRCVRDRK